MKVYIIAWTGGLESPQFAAFGTELAAQNALSEWMGDGKPWEDYFDIFAVDLTLRGPLQPDGSYPIESLKIEDAV